MKPQRFKIGQAVTPKVNMQWPINNDIGYLGISPRQAPNPVPEMPKQGEIYHVDGYQAYDDGIWGIFLSEYNHELTFNEEKFDPVELTGKEIADLIGESILTPSM